MIGACDCTDELRQPDGSWVTTDAIWNARWFLNGHGIQDVYWSDTFATTNLRLFDPERDAWFVNFVQAPSNAVGAGQWTGGEVATEAGRTMVMWNGSPDRANGSRLTFFAITDDGFRWKAETVVNGAVQSASWTSTCVRRTAGQADPAPRFLGYEPGPAQPFGRRHPNAPPAVDELAFLVGDHRFERDGEEPGRAVTRWVLNGHALQQDAWTADRATSTFWLFDRSQGRWRASSFGLPGYAWTVWDGRIDGGEWVGDLTLQNGAAPPEPRRRTVAPTADGGYEIVDERTDTGQRVDLRTLVRAR